MGPVPDLERVARRGERRSAARPRSSCLLPAVVGLLLIVSTASAHHGSAAYDVDREITVRGTVTAFRWTNPHLRVVVRVVRPDGTVTEWDCEGPPLTWAAQRGWSEATLVRDEVVTLVLYPLKATDRGAPINGGLVKRIVRASGTLDVSRPWLDRP